MEEDSKKMITCIYCKVEMKVVTKLYTFCDIKEVDLKNKTMDVDISKLINSSNLYSEQIIFLQCPKCNSRKKLSETDIEIIRHNFYMEIFNN